MSTIDDALKSPSLTLLKIKDTIGVQGARAVVVLAISELVSFFNVQNTMSAEQVALTTDLILESYWYFRIEDIKYCFRRAMRRGKVFGRIDGNLIFEWLDAYDLERDQRSEAAEINLNAAYKSPEQVERTEGGITFTQYIESLKRRASEGDKDAQDALDGFERIRSSKSNWNEEREAGFREYYKQYLINQFTKK